MNKGIDIEMVIELTNGDGNNFAYNLMKYKRSKSK